MKFLCDRCKTRYSIGDERVRGKILKIRCKNCANIITVREGMVADVDADASQLTAPEYPGRAKKTTLMAPTALSEASEPEKEAKEAREAREAHDPAKDQGGVAGPARVASPASVAGLGRPARPGGPAGPGAPAVGARALAGAAQDKASTPGAAAARRVAPADDPGRGQAGAGRRGPAAEAPRVEPANALGAAFASAMTKPPPALEEEWYVSLDGDQAGPFSLAAAQRWVAQKSIDAELHCWSEGFDDWLPVDKVSHFRGLRQRSAAPTAPPAFPRGGGLPRPAPGATEAEPKPLFAATMASLERGAPVAANPGPQLPSPGTPSVRAVPSLGSSLPPRGNAAASAPNGARENGAKVGLVTSLPARADARLPVPRPAGSPPGPARGSVVEDSFDIDTSEGVDGQTQLEDMPFADSIVETRRPSRPAVGADPGPSSSDAALTSPRLPASSTLPGTGGNAAGTSAAPQMVDGDDDLSIGEVSRVVKLADLERTPKNPDRSGPVRRSKPTTVVGGRRTGGHPILRSTASVPSIPGAPEDSALAALPDGDPAMTMAPVRKSHRRGLITLFSVAGAMVLGVVGAVILLVTTSDDSTSSDLGSVRDIDTSRPEDTLTHRPIAAGPIAPTTPTPPGPFVPRPQPHLPRPNPSPTGTSHDPEPPAGNALRGDEIEDVARKHQDMTQRCYIRSQRGADAILIGDVKKIAVTLLIDKDGNVSDVQLSDHAADNLGKCLSGSIRGWKFRQSSGGTFRFSLNFVSG